MEDRQVQYQAEGGRALLTIDREKARNSLSPEVISQLHECLSRAEADQEIRVVVLTGAGEKAFSAGGDLSGMSADGFLGGHEGRRRYGALLLRLQSFPKPTVARVNGHALAGGLGLLLCCDLAVAADRAEFGTPEIDVGLFPMMVMALLVRHLGRKRALELVMTGERICAERAREWGLINRVVPAAELDGAVAALVEKLAQKSRAVLGLGKRAFLTAEDLPLEQAIEFLASQLSLNVCAEDAAEGVTAFLEKRKPRWNDR
ncbi:MAG: enoyl-CoA hydratase/isomerase family protein [Myxococcales bacterium]|nr:enoyl-CoA hydratase/isomerase family protein [Myxococcales bacterium]